MLKRKGLLIVAHAFPPSGGASVRRILKVVKHLANWDWDITVLAPKRGEYFAYPYDPALLSQIPGRVRIVESFTPERLFMIRSVAAGAGGKGANSPTAKMLFTDHYRKIYKSLGGLIAIPESSITWLPFAAWQGKQIIRKHNIDVIFATAPPFSALLVGTTLKKLTGIPLVVEFRDAWTAEPARNRDLDEKRRWVEKMQEAWVIRTADRIVSVTEGVTSDFIRRYSDVKAADSFITIPNGFDRDDLTELQTDGVKNDRNDRDERFKIVHTGTLGGVRTPRLFLHAIHRLIIDQPSLRSRLKVIFVGHCKHFSDGSTIEEYVQNLNLQDVVEITGFVSRDESLRYQNEADLLLLLIGLVPASEAQRYGLSAKVFDYTLAAKPVLAIAEDGPTAEFVRVSGIGEVVSHYDEAGMISAIERALEGNLHHLPCQAAIDEYDYTALMRNLESVLWTTCGV